jgi:hypothetical protein
VAQPLIHPASRDAPHQLTIQDHVLWADFHKLGQVVVRRCDAGVAGRIGGGRRGPGVECQELTPRWAGRAATVVLQGHVGVVTTVGVPGPIVTTPLCCGR